MLVADAGELVGVATVVVRRSPEFGVFVQQQWGVLDNIAAARAFYEALGYLPATLKLRKPLR